MEIALSGQVATNGIGHSKIEPARVLSQCDIFEGSTRFSHLVSDKPRLPSSTLVTGSLSSFATVVKSKLTAPMRTLRRNCNMSTSVREPYGNMDIFYTGT